MAKFRRKLTTAARLADELVVTVSVDGHQSLEMTEATRALLERETAWIGREEAMALFMEQVFEEYRDMAREKKDPHVA